MISWITGALHCQQFYLPPENAMVAAKCIVSCVLHVATHKLYLRVRHVTKLWFKFSWTFQNWNRFTVMFVFNKSLAHSFKYHVYPNIRSPPPPHISNFQFTNTSIQNICRSWYLASLMYSFKYNQQDATLYNILYCCQCCTYFRRFFRPSSGAQTVHTAFGICQACLLLPLAWVCWHC
jgi:hypothetical protein